MKKMIKKIIVVIGWIVLGWLLGFISCTLLIREISINDTSSHDVKAKEEKPLSTEKKVLHN